MSGNRKKPIGTICTTDKILPADTVETEKILKISLLWFSGTGNTLLVARWLEEELNSNPAISAIHGALEHRVNLNASEAADALIILSPVTAFTLPLTVFKSILKLPDGKGRPALVCVTRGAMAAVARLIPGMEGTAAATAALLLQMKGYRVLGTRTFDMPSNWCLAAPEMNYSLQEELFEKSRKLTLRAARMFADNLIEKINTNITEKWSDSEEWSISKATVEDPAILTGLLLLPLSILYLLAGRIHLASSFFATTACTGCGTCAGLCPQKAIRMRGRKFRRPAWSFRCISCMRCIAMCPSRAIEASHLPVAVSAFLAMYAFRTSQRKAEGKGHSLLHTLISAAFHSCLAVKGFHKLWTKLFMDPHIAGFMSRIGAVRILGIHLAPDITRINFQKPEQTAWWTVQNPGQK